MRRFFGNVEHLRRSTCEEAYVGPILRDQSNVTSVQTSVARSSNVLKIAKGSSSLHVLLLA